MRRALLILLFSVSLWGCNSSFEKTSYEEFRSQAKNSYVQLKDGWTNYELLNDKGSNHTVVLIHGGTIPNCIWDLQVEALTQAGFRVLRYDQYGRGYSDRPILAHSRDLFLHQLKGLLDSLSITEPVSLIGPSFGGTIAVNFAANYPERVRSLVLVSPALNLLNSNSPLAGNIKLLNIPVLGVLLYKLFARNKIIDRGKSLAPGGEDGACAVAFRAQFDCQGTENSLLSTFAGDAYGDYHAETRKAGQKVKNILLLRGAKDMDVTEKMILEIRDDLPQAKYIRLEKSGHSPATDDPELFNTLVIDYLKEH